MAIRYDDGFVYGNALTTSTVHVQLRSDSTPDEAGCRFRLPVGMTAIGLRVGLDTSWGATATADVVLYDDSDTVLASTSIGDKDYVDDADYVDVWFDAVNLVAGAYYRLVVKATTSGVGGNTFLQRYQFNGTAERDSWPPGDGNWVYTSRTDAGAWTEVDTDLCYIALWVSAIAFTSAYAYSG